jgi:hypothetical protein
VKIGKTQLSKIKCRRHCEPVLVTNETGAETWGGEVNKHFAGISHDITNTLQEITDIAMFRVLA